ncbi:MAG: FliM/FliN family flagellar motor switch protein [Sphingomonadales bacterium]|nr:FliM/FliN family flagellar motor switch protein [Sphingomonadales bacterium]
MKPVEPWLPAAAPGAVEQAIRKIVARWEGQWFVGPPAIKVTGQAINSLRGEAWSALGDVFVGQMRDTLTQVGLKVCNDAGQPHNPRDSALLAKVGRDAIDELLGALGVRSEPAKTRFETISNRKGLLGFKITHSVESWSLALVVGPVAQIRIRQLAARSEVAPQLGSLKDALEVEAFVLSAFLGQSQLSSSEVAALGIGDVVMFDRKVADPAPLEISGRVPKQGSARVVRHGDVLSLTLTSEISVEARETATQ